jgi:hypothetical protein
MIPNSYYIMANAMIYAGYKPVIDCRNIQNYFNSGVYTYCNGEEIIEEYAKEFVNN